MQVRQGVALAGEQTGVDLVEPGGRVRDGLPQGGLLWVALGFDDGAVTPVGVGVGVGVSEEAQVLGWTSQGLFRLGPYLAGRFVFCCDDAFFLHLKEKKWIEESSDI